MDALQSLQFSIGVIKVATENFADDNKLGEGGFGTVYKVFILVNNVSKIYQKQ